MTPVKIPTICGQQNVTNSNELKEQLILTNISKGRNLAQDMKETAYFEPVSI